MRVTPEPVEELNRQYWQFCNQGRLCLQHCRVCGNWQHIPRYLCGKCHGEQLEWAEVSGRGRVYSWTVTRVALHPAFAAQVPYAVLLVELEEGARMLAGLKNLSIDRVELDMPVEVVFERMNENVAMPFFQPVSKA